MASSPPTLMSWTFLGELLKFLPPESGLCSPQSEHIGFYMMLSIVIFSYDALPSEHIDFHIMLSLQRELGQLFISPFPPREEDWKRLLANPEVSSKEADFTQNWTGSSFLNWLIVVLVRAGVRFHPFSGVRGRFTVCRACIWAPHPYTGLCFYLST